MKKTLLILATLVALVALTWKLGKTRAGGGGGTAPAPEVTFKDLEGKDVPLSSLRGKVVLVNFWATWCDPCRAEIPWLIELQDKYGARGFTVLGVALDDGGKKVVEPFVQSQRFDVKGVQSAMNYPNVLGTDEIVSKFGGILGYPTSFLISRDGKKIRTYLGPIELNEVEKVIEGQL